MESVIEAALKASGVNGYAAVIIPLILMIGGAVIKAIQTKIEQRPNLQKQLDESAASQIRSLLERVEANEKTIMSMAEEMRKCEHNNILMRRILAQHGIDIPAE
jgi:hypothetical protein